jgi:hypothetical protein
VAERSHDKETPAAAVPEQPKAATRAVTSGAASLLALQRAAGNQATVAHVQRKGSEGGGAGLPPAIKSGIESLSGISMDGVKVNYNSSAPAAIGASAMTQGNEIHVAPGKESHLVHEAWHVVQQRQGRVAPTVRPGVPVSDAVALEEEADVMGAKAVQT